MHLLNKIKLIQQSDLKSKVNEMIIKYELINNKQYKISTIDKFNVTNTINE